MKRNVPDLKLKVGPPYFLMRTHTLTHTMFYDDGKVEQKAFCNFADLGKKKPFDLANSNSPQHYKK